jgi:hypothetical protein
VGLAAALALVLATTAGAGRLTGPYGLTEEEINGLNVRSTALRDFGEFVAALLLDDEVDRGAVMETYHRLRGLAYGQRRAQPGPTGPTEVKRQVWSELWGLSAPTLVKVDLGPDPTLEAGPAHLRFTRGLENRVLLLVRNRAGRPVRLAVGRGAGDGPSFSSATADVDEGEVRPFLLRVWGDSGGALRLRLDGDRTAGELPLPIAWTPSGALRVQVRDAGGYVPARVYVVGSDRLARAPSGSFLRTTWSGGHSYFHTQGSSTLALPAGPADVMVVRGFEHVPERRRVEVEAGRLATAEFRLERSIDAAARGWYSGDIHIHPNLIHKTLDQVVGPEDVRLQVQAEDLNVANLLVCNSLGDIVYDRDRFTGAPSPLSTPRHILYWSEEVRTSLYGHMSVLNLRTFLEPPYNGFVTSRAHPFDYPSNTTQARRAHAQGAGVFYVHPASFPVTGLGATSAKALPVDAALGASDGMEILGYGETEASTDLYHRLLNCGFRLAAAAGTDTFDNIRLHKIPGGDRVYVHLAGPLGYSAWVDGLRAGRSFVTNGPLLFFTVDGRRPGSGLTLQRPGTVEVKVGAHSQVPMTGLEILRNGTVVATATPEAGGRVLDYRGTIAVERSSWLAARIRGGKHPLVVNNPALFAHTSPVYCYVGGRPIAEEKDLRFFLRWVGDLRARLVSEGLFERREHEREVLAQFDEAAEVYRKRLAVLEAR